MDRACPYMYTLIFNEKIALSKNDAMMRDLCFLAYGCTAEGSGTKNPHFLRGKFNPVQAH